MLRGLLAIGLAVCAFVWPQQTVGLFTKLLGAYFLIDGLIAAVSAYRGGEKASHMLQVVVSLALGVVLLLWSGISDKVFLILVGIWLVLQGASLLLAAFRMGPDAGEKNLTMAIAAVSAVIGLVFVFWPDTGVTAISWLIGLGALVIGALLVFLATRVRRLRNRVDAIGGA